MKISKSKLERIIREEVSNYLSNIYKWCPDGQKCPPGSEKTKWWKGPSVSKDLDEEIAGVLEAHQMPIAGFSYRGAAYKRDDDEVDPYERPMESPLEEEAPPGMGDEVEALKRKHPDDVAFKIAWSIYNKKNNKS